MNQNAGHADLVVADRNHKEPTNLDLIYFDESPDYCVRDLSLGKYQSSIRYIVSCKYY